MSELNPIGLLRCPALHRSIVDFVNACRAQCDRLSETGAVGWMGSQLVTEYRALIEYGYGEKRAVDHCVILAGEVFEGTRHGGYAAILVIGGPVANEWLIKESA